MMTTKSLFDKNRWVKRLSSEDDGAVAAWFVLFLTVFIGMGALAIDFSYAFMVRHKIQITASSAALAGAALRRCPAWAPMTGSPNRRTTSANELSYLPVS